MSLLPILKALSSKWKAQVQILIKDHIWGPLADTSLKNIDWYPTQIPKVLEAEKRGIDKVKDMDDV